jgi:hypothetical protein
MEIGMYDQEHRVRNGAAVLLTVQAGDGTADDEALDLAGALEDGEFVGRTR